MSLALYFVRHAPVIGQDGIAYGRDAEIDATCTDKFEAAAQKLPAQCNIWIASEFPRARKTARILKTFTSSTKMPMIYAAFNEQDFGALAGRRKKDIVADPAARPYLEDMANTAPPAGESVPAMMKRVGRGLHELKRYMIAFKETEAVIVCHGGVIRSVDSIHKNKPFDLHMKVPHLSVHSYTFDL